MSRSTPTSSRSVPVRRARNHTENATEAYLRCRRILQGPACPLRPRQVNQTGVCSVGLDVFPFPRLRETKPLWCTISAPVPVVHDSSMIRIDSTRNQGACQPCFPPAFAPSRPGLCPGRDPYRRGRPAPGCAEQRRRGRPALASCLGRSEHMATSPPPHPCLALSVNDKAPQGLQRDRSLLRQSRNAIRWKSLWLKTSGSRWSLGQVRRRRRGAEGGAGSVADDDEDRRRRSRSSSGRTPCPAFPRHRRNIGWAERAPPASAL